MVQLMGNLLSACMMGVRKKSPPWMAVSTSRSRWCAGVKAGRAGISGLVKTPRMGAGCRARNRVRKDGEEATARRHGRQVRAARTSVAREGRSRKISRSRSSPREWMVVRLSICSGGGTTSQSMVVARW
jgi:hypothetical protein